MRQVALALLVAVLCGGQARAADPITQDRDEPGRNPLQQSVFPVCNKTNSCACVFPAVPDHYRYVVTELTIQTFANGFDTLFAQLDGSNYSLPSAASPLENTPILRYPMTYIGAWGPGAAAYAFHGPVLAYFLWKDVPRIDVFDGQGTAITNMNCSITGYTVTMP